MAQILTLVADRAATSLTPAIVARARDAAGGAEPVTLSPGEAVDLKLADAADLDAVRAALGDAPIDAIATTTENRRKRLLVADMDSTIVTGETLDELADFAGLKQRIAAITARAMNDELDFKSALRERVAMLRGLSVEALEQTWQRVRLTPGAGELVATMRAHGAYAALVSGGFTFFTSRVAALVRIRHASCQRAAGRWHRPDRARRRTDPRSRYQARHADAAGGGTRVADGGNAGGRRWRQRPGHAARCGSRCGVPRQADRRCGSPGARRPCGTCGRCCSPRVTGGRISSADGPASAATVQPTRGLARLPKGQPAVADVYAARRAFHAPDSAYARERGAAFAEKLRRGERVYLAGIGPAGHDSGVALVEASRDDGIRLLCNNEEERYSGVRHCTTYPEQSLYAMQAMMENLGIDAGEIHACVASWDYITLAATLLRSVAEELPASRVFLDPANSAAMNASHIARAFKSPLRLGKQFGLDRPMPIIGMRHHDNHAYFSYAVSPFAGSDEPVMISVLDGIGDDGAISLYLAQGDAVR